MENQAQTGKRTNGPTQARGRARREQLLNSAAALMAEKELEDISFIEVAQHAGIPKGSAYHFYANIMDLYSALTARIGQDLFEHLSQPFSDRSFDHWHDVIYELINRAVDFYHHSPAARQLLIGGKTPPQFKRADRDNDRRLGETLKQHFEKVFILPSIQNELDVFFYTVEIIDLMFVLSMLRENAITEDMAAEAKRAAIAYLETYLPRELPRR